MSMRGAQVEAWITAIATVVLATLTGWYVWSTSRLSQRAADSAEAARVAAHHAERSADAAERLVLRESMPLVVPRSGGGSRDRWKFVVENVGRAPALHTLVELHPGYEGGERVASVAVDIVKEGEQIQRDLPKEASLLVSGLLMSPMKKHRFEVLYTNAFGDQFQVVREAGLEDGAPYFNIRTYRREDNFGEWIELG